MIEILTNRNDPFRDHLLNQMFTLGRRQFRDRRNWRVSAHRGMETDRFDDLDPVYVAVTDGDDNLLGAIRLLKTVGPHMLTDVFPEILDGAPAPRHPRILECSRFVVDTELSREFGESGLDRVTQELLYCLFSYAQEQDIKQFVAVHDLFIDIILRRAGCDFKRIGKVITCDDGLKACASIFDVSPKVINRLYSPEFQFAQPMVPPFFAGTPETGYMVRQ